jgi:FkbM family methyltransferase
MANFFDYNHSAVIPTTENGVSVVDYSQPKLHRLRRSGLEFEFPSLPEADESVDGYIHALKLKPGDVVFDLGAYAGASSYFLAQAVGPAGMVVAFEPDPATFKFLEANVARHQLPNIRPVNKGIWSETKQISFQSEQSLGSANVSVLGRDSNVKTIDAVTLEDAAALTDGRRVAAIKMDIEGAEIPVLKNAGNFLLQHRPTLVIEVHFIDGKQPVDYVCEILRSYGYSVGSPSQGTADDGTEIGGLIAAWPN